ncbi:MAG: hypothetical protein V7638_2493 [Acidobacteriota bacterium]|jgi:hypothetical protein
MKSGLLLFLVLTFVAKAASAHIVDEYLQAVQISFTPDAIRIEMCLTAGVDVADRVFAAIDRDHNGQVSPTEQQAYAQRVLHDLTLEVDGHLAPLTLTSTDFPSRSAMKQGDAAIHLDFSAPVSLNSPGAHQLTFRNNHWPQIGVYQANALVPTTDSIKITGQQRDRSQHQFELQFHVDSVAPSAMPATVRKGAAPDAHSWTLWTRSLLVGVYLLLLST